MGDEAVIRKLVADGDGTSEDKRIVQLFSLINTLRSAGDVKTVSNKILNSLDQIELSIRKQCFVSEVYESDTKNSEEMFLDIDSLLDREAERMELVNKELVAAKLIRKNRQEYDALAKLIKERPSRAETLASLKKLQVELDEDQERQKELEQKLSEKRRNMYLLAILLNNLENDESDSSSPVPMDEGEELTKKEQDT